MFSTLCPHCQTLSPEDSNVCSHCGAPLSATEGEAAATPAAALEAALEAPATASPENTGAEFAFESEARSAPAHPLNRVPEMHWFLVLVLQVITLGVYTPVWYLRRAEAFNDMSAGRALNKGLLASALLGHVGNMLIGIIGGLHERVSQAWAANASVIIGDYLNDLGTFLSWFVAALLIHQALTLRSMLKRHALAATGRELPIGWLWTIILGPLNLQHAVNRLKDRGCACD